MLLIRNRSWRPWVSRLLILVIVVFFLYLALRGVDWRQFLSTLERSHPGYLVVVCLWMCGTQFLRGARWWLLLRVERPISLSTVFWVTAGGQLVNNFLPGRSGDLFRAMHLARNASRSTSYALATTLTERVIDLAVLTVIVLVGLGSIKDLPSALISAVWILAALAVIGVALLFAVPKWEAAIQGCLQYRLVPEGLRPLLRESTSRFMTGLKALHQHRSYIPFAVLTALIWGSEAVGACILAQGLNLALSLKDALFLNSLIGLSTVVSPTPGGLGLNQFLAVTVMPYFGFSPSQALAFVILGQALFYVITSALGAIALMKLGFGQGAELDRKGCAPPS